MSTRRAGKGMPVALAVAFAASFGATSLAARAAPPPPTATAPTATAPTAAAPTTPVPAPPPSALRSVAARLVTETRTANEPVIFVAPVRSDEPAPRGDELVGKLATLLAAGLGPSVTVRPERTSLATAQAAARSAPLLLYLQVEIASGQLRANADVYPTTRNVWDRARRPAPVPTAHGFATARIDGEVRSYLSPVPLVISKIDRATLEDGDVVALACGDLDEDGTLEVATLSRRKISLGRVRGSRFVALRTTALRDLSGIAPVPLREPLGGLSIVPRERTRAAYLDVGITDRARGSRLDGELRLLGPIAGVPFSTPGGDACLQFEGSTLVASVAKCADVDPIPPPSDIDVPLDAAAGASFVTAGGVVRQVHASRDPRTSELRLRGDGRSAAIPRAGAQVALADLDQDGSVEIISTLDVLPRPGNEAVDDALVITTWQSDGSLRERARTAVPAGVRAVAACPPEAGRMAPIVVATEGELWVLR